jgi:hypothetical protein
MLINVSLMTAAGDGINSISASLGTIYHSSDPLVIENNPTPDYLPFALFYGPKSIE